MSFKGNIVYSLNKFSYLDECFLGDQGSTRIFNNFSLLVEGRALIEDVSRRAAWPIVSATIRRMIVNCIIFLNKLRCPLKEIGQL